MTIPIDEIAICNMALSHLGQTGISSIEAPTTEAESTCALWYDQVRQQLLREYVWNFAKARASISRTGTPEFDWADRYALPNDCLRILSINGDIELTQETDYDIEGRTILLNNGGATTASLRYIKDETSVQKWDALFKNLMALTLALKMAYKFTLKKGVLDKCNELLALDLPKAVTIAGQERPPRKIQRSKYLQKRRLGGTSMVADRFTVLD